MSRIRSKNTKPEILVRKKLYESGIRYRVHVADLPGRPDIAIKKYNLIVEVRGCFWHGHKKCKFSSSPKSNVSYWTDKIKRNKKRDLKNFKELHKKGFKVFVIWECQTKTEKTLMSEIKKIKKYLSEKSNQNFPAR